MNPDTLVDTLALALLLNVKPATIRQWATRGKLQPQGKDRRGRTLYNITEARAVTGGQPPPLRPSHS